MSSAHPNRLYYVALVVSLVVYVLLRYVARTPFGLTLQGLRDDPVRMGSLGYNVALHRTIAFAFAGVRRGDCRVSSSSGGTATSTRPRSTSARRSTCS